MNQAATGYLSLYFFIFLSLQFSTLKFFVTFFSGTVRPRRLKLGTDMDSGQMYHVYRNQAAALLLICPFISSFFFLQFSNIKVFRHTFLRTVRPRRLKLGTHMDSGQMHCVYRNQVAALICPFISSVFFLSSFKH